MAFEHSVRSVDPAGVLVPLLRDAPHVQVEVVRPGEDIVLVGPAEAATFHSATVVGEYISVVVATF